MDYNLNYYSILSVKNTSTDKEIRKSYYKLSLIHHPDKGGDSNEFDKITKSYDILMDTKKRGQYDIRSRFGQFYDESLELLDFEFNNDSKTWDKDKFDKFKRDEVLNIVVHITDDFDGSLEYERMILCKSCSGSGKDLKSKIEIKDKSGKVIKTFDPSDGCDFCEGSGIDYRGKECSFCFGNGKVGMNVCKSCNGDKRILGKQKISGVVLSEDGKTKISHMGHFSKDIPGKTGILWLIKTT
jgi:DnaJ family protein A protein 2